VIIGRILALAIGLLCALAASQLPEFAQQYRQRLGGAIEELGRVVGRFDDSAQASGLSRDQAIARLGEQPDPLVRREGEAMSGAAERLVQLRRQRDDLAGAGSFERLLVFVRQVDPGLARATYLDFEPAVPATTEGVIAGAIGFILGWGGMLFLAHIIRRLLPRRRRHRIVAMRSA
jgi:hypothetical protein